MRSQAATEAEARPTCLSHPSKKKDHAEEEVEENQTEEDDQAEEEEEEGGEGGRSWEGGRKRNQEDSARRPHLALLPVRGCCTACFCSSSSPTRGAMRFKLLERGSGP